MKNQFDTQIKQIPDFVFVSYDAKNTSAMELVWEQRRGDCQALGVALAEESSAWEAVYYQFNSALFVDTNMLRVFLHFSFFFFFFQFFFKQNKTKQIYNP